MSRAHLIYPLQNSRARELEKIEADPYNRTVLSNYFKIRETQVEITTVIAEFARLNSMSRMLGKGFTVATRKDIIDLNSKIERLEICTNTKNKCRKVLKAFFRWLKGFPKGSFPPIVRDITLKKIPITSVRAKDLLSVQEIVQISEKSVDPRLKALIQNKVDGACRIGELLTSTIGEVEFTKYGAEINCDGKTGDQEPIILSWSAPTLAQWLNVHPFRDNPESPIYPAQPYSSPKYWQYSAARSAFLKCVKKAGVSKKRIWFHLLKHIGCTEDAKTRESRAQLY